MSVLFSVGAGLSLLFGLAAVYLLLPKVRERLALPPGLAFIETGLRRTFAFLDKHRLKIGVPAGVVALALSGGTLLAGDARSAENVLFYLFSAAALVGGVLLITQRNPARAAVSFVLVVLSTCGLFLLLGAPFLMAGTAIIYAGAIVVTFLFVLMLAQQEGPSDADYRSREPLLACLAGFVLLGGLLFLIHTTFGTDELDASLQRTGRIEDRLAELAARADASSSSSDALSAEANAALVDADKLLKDKRWSDLFGSQGKDPTRPGYMLKRAVEDGQLTMTAYVGSQNGQPKKEKLTGEEIKEATERVKDSLAAVRVAGLVLRSAAGQLPFEPRWADAAPPPVLPANQVRHDELGRPQLPAENTAYLGQTLFSDYLVPVGAAGVLLLVATIGAIAIATRQPGRAP